MENISIEALIGADYKTLSHKEQIEKLVYVCNSYYSGCNKLEQENASLKKQVNNLECELGMAKGTIKEYVDKVSRRNMQIKDLEKFIEDLQEFIRWVSDGKYEGTKSDIQWYQKAKENC